MGSISKAFIQGTQYVFNLGTLYLNLSVLRCVFGYRCAFSVLITSQPAVSNHESATPFLDVAQLGLRRLGCDCPGFWFCQGKARLKKTNAKIRSRREYLEQDLKGVRLSRLPVSCRSCLFFNEVETALIKIGDGPSELKNTKLP